MNKYNWPTRFLRLDYPIVALFSPTLIALIQSPGIYIPWIITVVRASSHEKAKGRRREDFSTDGQNILNRDTREITVLPWTRVCMRFEFSKSDVVSSSSQTVEEESSNLEEGLTGRDEPREIRATRSNFLENPSSSSSSSAVNTVILNRGNRAPPRSLSSLIARGKHRWIHPMPTST